MVTIKKFVFNPFSENTYVVFDENNTAVIIDPGMYYSAEERIIDDFLSENELELKAIIHTHSHLDHMFGTAYLAEKYQLSPYLFEKDFETYKSFERVCEMYGIPIRKKPTENLQSIDLNKELVFGQVNFKVRHVPGHAPGHIVLINNAANSVINGDCLFYESIGRTDLPGGNHNLLLDSIRKELFTLPKETKVYCGHGPETFIGHEMVNNPFLNY